MTILSITVVACGGGIFLAVSSTNLFFDCGLSWIKDFELLLRMPFNSDLFGPGDFSCSWVVLLVPDFDLKSKATFSGFGSGFVLCSKTLIPISSLGFLTATSRCTVGLGGTDTASRLGFGGDATSIVDSTNTDLGGGEDTTTRRPARLPLNSISGAVSIWILLSTPNLSAGFEESDSRRDESCLIGDSARR